jgi:hypothetical protein
VLMSEMLLRWPEDRRMAGEAAGSLAYLR